MKIFRGKVNNAKARAMLFRQPIHLLLLGCLCLINQNIFAQQATSNAYKQDTTASFLYSTQMKVLFLMEGYYFHDKLTEIKQLDSIKFVPTIVTQTIPIRKYLTIYFIEDIYAVAYDADNKNIYRLKGFLENDYFWLKQANQSVNFSEFDTPNFRFSNLEKALYKKGRYVCDEMVSYRKSNFIIHHTLPIKNKGQVFWLSLLSIKQRLYLERQYQKQPPFRASKYDKLSCFSNFYPLFN